MEGTSSFQDLDRLRDRGRSRRRKALWSLVPSRPERAPVLAGTASVCSSHPLVLEAAIMQASEEDNFALIEATCNQVNHRGGYTGLTPAAFRDHARATAGRLGFPAERIVLGGDHLGPSPWRRLPAEEALGEAEVMVDAYVSAGYEKIHLDCSMGCLGEPEQLDDELAAERAARLAGVAERAAARAGTVPRYVVGTEVPRPGGALHEIDELEVTTPEAVSATWEAHARAFAKGGVGAALERAVAVVAHPGVEFDNRRVFVYRPERAARLSAWLDGHPALVFEAHSTDYQPAESLAELVRDGFCILKVGPGLTFAMREALYGLDHIASALHAGDRRRSLAQAMEEEMTSRPGYWQDYYPGSPQVQAVLRHFSLSDRIRYYWSSPNAEAAVAELFAELQGTSVPLPLVSQFLPRAYDRAASQGSDFQPRALVVEAVRDVLRTYSAAAHRAPRR